MYSGSGSPCRKHRNRIQNVFLIVQGMKDGRCTCPRGKAIGGSSVINYMMYSRPSKEDFDQWGASCPNFLFENVLPYFKKSEKADMENVDTDYHGLSGPLSVEHVKFDTPLTNVFIAGNKEMGMKEVDYNGNESLGVSKLQITTGNTFSHTTLFIYKSFSFSVKGRRCSTGKAFVTPSRKRKNFHLIDKTLVTKILIDQAKATGVEFFRNGRKYSANATKEVIISAGSINTPQLLILSGIGPKQELDRLKIPAVMDLSVGRNLHDHPAYLAVYFGTNITVENVDVIGIANDYIQGKGLLTTGMGVTGLGFVPFKNSQKPNIEYIFLSILVDDNLEAYYKNSMQVTDETYAALLGPLKGNKLAIGFVVVLEQPKSVGSITLRSNSPLDFPDIDFNYYSDENGDDLNQMVQGIKSLFALVQTEEFRKIGTNYLSAPFPPCSSLEHLSDDYWTCALKQLTTTLYHPVGTSKMGTGSDSVVDCDFKVRGVGRLRVVDASVAPYSLAGHTNALAIMIGEMAADVIKSQH